MDLEIVDLMIIIGLTTRLIWLKLNYVIHDAVCLDYTTSNYGWVTYPLYEYEMMVEGKMVVYKNWGTNYFSPCKGKRCKVLINKANYDKVIGANEYIADIIYLIIFFVSLHNKTFILKVIERNSIYSCFSHVLPIIDLCSASKRNKYSVACIQLVKGWASISK